MGPVARPPVLFSTFDEGIAMDSPNSALKGGQGREDEELVDLVESWAMLALVAFMLIVIVACLAIGWL
jgi:hypothetical protein